MKKLKLCGIRKDENRAEFTIDKTQSFVPIIRKLITKFTGDKPFYFLLKDEEENGPVDERIGDLTDSCVHTKHKEYEFDIFFGKEKIILVVRSSLKNQKKFVKEIMKFCVWKKPKKFI